LILHEITAIVPLVGLAAWFHYSNWLPSVFVENETLKPGIEKFGRYFRRKGWFGLDQDTPVDVDGSVPVITSEGEGEYGQAKVALGTSPGTRIVVEVAAAYAITKALLPLRIILSVWATPWFARVFIGKIWGGIRGLGSGKGNIGKMTTGVGRDIPKP
jgi:hypothetical protein